MKRFKIEFTIKGEEHDLFAEDMDFNKRMYSIERELMDPHPLLIEKKEDGKWIVSSQDNWQLSPEDVTRLGETLDREYHQRPQQNT